MKMLKKENRTIERNQKVNVVSRSYEGVSRDWGGKSVNGFREKNNLPIDAKCHGLESH